MEQLTEEWYEARRGKLTASRIKRLFAGPSTVERLMQSIRREIEEGPGGWLEGRDADSAAMAHGREYEDRAIALYEMLHDVETERVGLILHPMLRGVGASCDRIQLLDGKRLAPLEVKCPVNPTIHERTLLYGMPQEHMYQVQTQLACTGLPFGYFLSYNDTFPPEQRLYRERVQVDEVFVAKLRQKVAQFWRLFDAGQLPTAADVTAIPQFF